MDDIEERKNEIIPEIMAELEEVLRQKGIDYGGSWRRLGLQGLFCRVTDKYFRMKNLLWIDKEAEVKDETLEDTIGDMANYCLLMLAWMKICKEQKWNKKKLMKG